ELTGVVVDRSGGGIYGGALRAAGGAGVMFRLPTAGGVEVNGSDRVGRDAGGDGGRTAGGAVGTGSRTASADFDGSRHHWADTGVGPRFEVDGVCSGSDVESGDVD